MSILAKQQAIIVVSLVVLAIIVVSGVRIWDDRIAPRQQALAPNTVPVWKTLSNDSGHYEIQYPSDLTVFNYHRETDVSLYSRPTAQTNAYVAVLWGDTGRYGTSGAELKLSSEDELTKVVDAFMALWNEPNQKAADGGFVTYEKEHKTFNGYDAIALVGTRTAPQEWPREARSYTGVLHAYFILHKGRVFKIQYSDLYKDKRQVMDSDEAKMLASFKFTD